MNIALILAGGIGKRLGRDIPKQYISVEGKMIITHCLQVVSTHPKIDAIQIVADEQWREKIYRQMPEAALRKFSGFAKPGPSRQHSIINGLELMMPSAQESDIIIIHDAVRPFVTKALISACVEACAQHDGALPVLQMKDTVYMGEDGCVTSLLERDKVYSGQAPEAFHLIKYYQANRRLKPDRIEKINGSTEPAVLAGMDIAMIPGDEKNFKITTPLDLERCKLWIRG